MYTHTHTHTHTLCIYIHTQKEPLVRGLIGGREEVREFARALRPRLLPAMAQVCMYIYIRTAIAQVREKKD